MAIVAAARAAAMTACVLLGTEFLGRVISQRGRGAVRDGDSTNHADGLPKVFRRHANELPKLGIAGRIDCDATEEVEFPDESPRRLQILESPVAGRATPGPNDPEAPAPYPVAPQIDDEVFFAARDNERPEHLPAVPETRAQVCLLEDVVHPVPPVHTASLLPSVGPAIYWTENR